MRRPMRRGGELCRCMVKPRNRCSWPPHTPIVYGGCRKAGKHNGSGGHSAPKPLIQMEDEAGLYITSYDSAEPTAAPTQRGSGGCDIRLCQSAWYATGRSRCNGKNWYWKCRRKIFPTASTLIRALVVGMLGIATASEPSLGVPGCQDSGKGKATVNRQGNLNISATDRCGIVPLTDQLIVCTEPARQKPPYWVRLPGMARQFL